VKTILVQADLGKSFQARMAVATSIAQQHGARIRGLYVIPLFEMAGYSKYSFPKSVLEERSRAEHAEAQAAENVFRTCLEDSGVEGEWLVQVGDLCETLCGFSRLTDLLIMGQRDPKGSDNASPDRVVLRAGRPVMVTPHVAFDEQAGSRVLIAWDGSRESARAVHDALPLLEKATQVDVVTFTEPKSEAAKVASLDAVLAFLQERGVSADGESLVLNELSVGESLLNRVVDRGANMLVMGGYGQSRLREIVLGGVTRTVLEQSSIPVLMSR